VRVFTFLSSNPLLFIHSSVVFFSAIQIHQSMAHLRAFLLTL
jgi:hypothetical protein